MNRFNRHVSSLAGLVVVATATSCSGGTGITEGRALSLPRPVTVIVREVQRALSAELALVEGGTASGTCITQWDPSRAQEDVVVDGVVASSPGTSDGVVSTSAQANGRRYFEVVFEGMGRGPFNTIAVKADDPAGTTDGSYFLEAGCGLGVGDCANIRDFPDGAVVSVMADLDTGRVDFAVDGVLTESDGPFEPRALAIVPGAGPFRAGVTMSDGASARANFGAEAFAFAPPEGFVAWSTGDADDEGFCISAPQIIQPPAPVSATVDCESGHRLTGIDTGVRAEGDSETALLVLGVYEPEDTGIIDVQIDRPGHYALVLGSYESTTWNVRLGADVIVERIIGKGYENVVIDAPGIEDVQTASYVDGEDADYVSGHAWPYSFGGSDTVGFVGDAETRTGLPLAIFAGAYRTRSFTVQRDGTPITACR